ncbi:MAG: hypothetical protein A2289_01490 [Deltaproteobacteria bacterium RIFOXYA12_FULL_58_15]|nr:MAG: hypothetical protein A2289_01490 [Deltaproteobacteria bacterium RIFOXYA12_FULL_58_15]OGR12668.1 MAG: hypothetical protein A2341_12475 [Deltaproteobacteria bacterium RIFOXYB12_FULL_58_9]
MATKQSFKALQYFFTFISWIGVAGLFGTLVSMFVPMVEVDSRLTYAAIMFFLSGIPSLLMFLTYRQLSHLFRHLRKNVAIDVDLIWILRRLGWLFLFSFASECVLYVTFLLTKTSFHDLYLYLELTNTDTLKLIELVFPTLGSGVGGVILFFALMGLAQFFGHHLALQQKVNTLESESSLTI